MHHLHKWRRLNFGGSSTSHHPAPNEHSASYLPHSFIDIRIVFYMHQLFAFAVSIIEITEYPVHGKLKGINYAKNLSIKVSLNHGITSMNLFNLQVWNVKMYQKIYDFCPRQSLN